jgi:uncharacterized membrane protein
MIIDFLFTKTPLFFLTQSLWRDEAFNYFLAKEEIKNILYLSSKDFTPPLYSILMKFWIYIFGPSEIAIRSLSFIAYLLLLYFFYLFLKKMLKINSFWIYVYMLLFISNPMLHYYAFEARGYSFFALFSFLSFYYFIQKKWKPYFYSTVIGLYLHYFMLLVLISQIVYILIFVKNKRVLKNLLFEISKPLIFFMPWLVYLFINNNLLNEPFWIKELKKNMLAYLPVILYTGYERSLWFAKETASKLNSFMILLFTFGFLYKKNIKKDKRKIFYLILLWSFVPSVIVLIFSIYKPLFFPRYLILSTPAILLLITSIVERFQPRIKTFFVILLLLFTLNYSTIQVEKNHKAPFKRIINEIKLQAKEGDLLYVESELDYHVAKYYFWEDRVFIYGKDYKEIPNFTGKVLIPKQSVVFSLPKYPIKAYVLHNDLSYDMQSLN